MGFFISLSSMIRHAVLGLAIGAILLAAVPVWAQHGEHGGATEAHEAAYGEHEHGHGSGWEGSPEGKAYSEFNHHLAGVFVILIALSEASGLLRRPGLARARFLLPVAMLGAGVFLLIWSDHDAWPIGSLTLRETLFGGDPEMLQHKTYGVLLLAVGAIEVLRRLGRLTATAWRIPLPAFAIIGGLMLFGHSHGAHPAAHKIAVHHAVMGALAISAGSSKLLAGGLSRPRWDLLWPLLILIIGLQLLVYSE
jgi:putative copper resistance protein D